MIRSLLTQWLASGLVGLGAIMLQVVLARSLGAADYGILGTTTALATVAMVVQNGAFRSIILREAVRPSNAAVTPADLTALAIGYVGASTVALMTGVAAIAALLQSWVLALLVLAIAANAPRVVAGFVSALDLARSDFSREACWQALSRLLPFFFTAIGAIATRSIVAVLLVLAVTQALVLALRIDILKHGLPPRLPGPPLRRAMGGLVTLDLTVQLYFRQGPPLLYLLGARHEDVGHYSLLLFLAEAVMLVLNPLLVRFHNRARAANALKIETLRFGLALWATASIGICVIAAVAMAASTETVGRILGQDFITATGLVPPFTIIVLIMIANALMGQTMIALERDRHYARIAAVMVLTALAANVVLIPFRGALGAAYALAVAEMTGAVLLVAELWRDR